MRRRYISSSSLSLEGWSLVLVSLELEPGRSSISSNSRRRRPCLRLHAHPHCMRCRYSSISSLSLELVKLGGSCVVGAEHQHAFSRGDSWGWNTITSMRFRGAILGVGIPGDFEETAPTPSSSSSESMGEEPTATRSVSLLQGGSGRYGASTYPFNPGIGGSLAPIRWAMGLARWE